MGNLQTLVAAVSEAMSLAFIELGVAMVVLAVLSRTAARWGFSAIPFYLAAGLIFGEGGLLPVQFSEPFVRFGSEVGVLLLLFMLGLEYTGEELVRSLRTGVRSGVVDFLLNFPPGVLFGYLLGLPWVAWLLLGGITYISSSGVVAKVLDDLGRLRNPETPAVVSILVFEDLAMAVYLPIVSVLVMGKGKAEGLLAVFIAVSTVLVFLYLAIRFGRAIGRTVVTKSDEGTLLTIIGLVLLVAGAAQQLQVSSAVGAFLVGVAISGSITRRVRGLLSPLRDLFAAIFFLVFGLQIDPSSLPPVVAPAAALALLSGLTKIATGWLAAGDHGCSRNGRLRAGAALVARGEFSIVIAGLAISQGFNQTLGPLAAAYVLFTAILGPLLVKLTPASTTVQQTR